MGRKDVAGRGSGEKEAALRGTRRKARGVWQKRKHGNRRGGWSCRGSGCPFFAKAAKYLNSRRLDCGTESHREGVFGSGLHEPGFPDSG
jgi:hypothetical protein